MIWFNSMKEMERPETSKTMPLSLLDLPLITLNHAKTPTTGGDVSMGLPENGTNNFPLPVHSFKKALNIDEVIKMTHQTAITRKTQLSSKRILTEK